MTIHNHKDKKTRFPAVKRSILLSVLITYVAVMIPLIAIIVFSGTRLSQSSYRSGVRINETVTSHLSKMLDTSLSSARNITLPLFMNETVQSAGTRKEHTIESKQLYELMTVYNHVVRQSMAYPLMKDIYLCFFPSETVVSTTGTYRNGTFAESSLKTAGIDYDQMMAMKDFSGNYRYSIYTQADQSPKLMLLCKYYPQINRSKNIAAYVIFDDAAITSLFNGMLYHEGSVVALMDGEGRLYGNQSPLHEEVAALLPAIQAQQKPTTLESADWVVSSVPSTIMNGWHLLSATPKAAFMTITPSVTALIILIAIALIITVILALHFSDWQARSIARLYDHVAASLTDGSGRAHRKSLYVTLDKGVDQIINDLKGRRDWVLSQQVSIREDVLLLKLLRSEHSDAAMLERICNDYQISFAHPFLTVVNICFDVMPSIAHIDEEDTEGLENALRKQIAAAVTSVLPDDYNCTVLLDAKHSLCLINGTSSQDDVNVLNEALQKAHHYLQECLQIDILCTIGSTQEHIAMLPQSYKDAVTAMDYAVMTGMTTGVLTYQKMQTSRRSEQPIDKIVQQHKKFSNQMATENFAEAHQSLLELISLEKVPEDNKFRFWQMINLSLSSILSASLTTLPIFWEEDFFSFYMEQLTELRNAPDMSKLHDVLDKIFDRLENQKPKETASSPAVISCVMSYVQSNYASSNISITGIADYFNVSVSYISRQFKQTYGIGMLDYIHKLRNDRAKQLMKTTDMTIKDIAAEVGYVNSLTMSRSFKRYEGILPSDYREMSAGNASSY